MFASFAKQSSIFLFSSAFYVTKPAPLGTSLLSFLYDFQHYHCQLYLYDFFYFHHFSFLTLVCCHSFASLASVYGSLPYSRSVGEFATSLPPLAMHSKSQRVWICNSITFLVNTVFPLHLSLCQLCEQTDFLSQILLGCLFLFAGYF